MASEVKQGRSALVVPGQNNGILETGVRWWADSSVTRSGPEGSSRNEVFWVAAGSFSAARRVNV